MSEHLHDLKRSIAKWPVIIAAILFLLYMITLHPISGFIGGFFFLFLNRWVPSVVNILISYWLASMVTNSFSIKRIFLTIIISMALGLNLLLLSWLISQPRNITVTVIKPLTLPSNKAYFIYNDKKHGVSLKILSGVNYFDESNTTISPFFFDIFEVNSSEGCGCMYFRNIPAVYTDGTTQHMLNQYFSVVTDRFGNKISNNAKPTTYKLSTQATIIGKIVLFKLFITDKNGGKVIVSAVYPRHFYVKSVTEYNKQYIFPDKNFAIHATNNFIYNNFWFFLFDQYLQAHIIDKSILLKHPEIFGITQK